jgi:hypothetical protein
MMLRRLLAVLLGGLAVVGSASADEAKPKSAARIAVEPEGGFDFGKVVQRKVLEKVFTIKNFGADELVIDSVTTTCGCTVAEGFSKNVKPGGSTTLRVTFNTGENRGRVVKNVLIQSNDPESAKVQLKIEADVAALPPTPAK